MAHLCDSFPPLYPITESRTTEFQVLETNGVPVVAYGTDMFPAFFSPSSGVRAPLRMDTPSEVAAAARVRERATRGTDHLLLGFDALGGCGGCHRRAVLLKDQ